MNRRDEIRLNELLNEINTIFDSNKTIVHGNNKRY